MPSLHAKISHFLFIDGLRHKPYDGHCADQPLASLIIPPLLSGVSQSVTFKIAWSSKDLQCILSEYLHSLRNQHPTGVLIHFEMHGGDHRRSTEGMQLPWYEVNYSRIESTTLGNYCKRFYKVSAGNLIVSMSACVGGDMKWTSLMRTGPIFSLLVAPLDSLCSSVLCSFNEEFYGALLHGHALEPVLDKYRSSIRAEFPEQMAESVIRMAYEHVSPQCQEIGKELLQKVKTDWLEGKASLTPLCKYRELYANLKR